MASEMILAGVLQPTMSRAIKPIRARIAPPQWVRLLTGSRNFFSILSPQYTDNFCDFILTIFTSAFFRGFSPRKKAIFLCILSGLLSNNWSFRRLVHQE